MRLLAPSVRARLTLWHAGCWRSSYVFSAAGIFLFVRARLYSTLDAADPRRPRARSRRSTTEETGDLGRLAHRMGITLFQVAEGRHRAVPDTRLAAGRDDRRSRLGALGDASHRIAAARDETAVRADPLDARRHPGDRRALRHWLAIGGRLLPRGPDARTCGRHGGDGAPRFTAESLTAAAPVENPETSSASSPACSMRASRAPRGGVRAAAAVHSGRLHELRTPLTAIRSVGEWRCSVPSVQRATARSSEACSRRSTA